MCSIEKIQYRAHYAKKCKSTDKGLSPRSFQHCLCPPHVSAESVSSRCIGHRWLTAASVAQIQLGEKISVFCHHWPTVPSAVGKKQQTCQWSLLGILKERVSISHMHTQITVTKRTDGFCWITHKLEIKSRSRWQGTAAMPPSASSGSTLHIFMSC